MYLRLIPLFCLIVLASVSLAQTTGTRKLESAPDTCPVTTKPLILFAGGTACCCHACV